jgi:polyphosphate kinase
MSDSLEQRSAGAELAIEDLSLYFNREISWLAFNKRVLEEGADTRWPLLERLKFLAIHASNLDEFFMIRVSGLHEQMESDIAQKSPDGLTPQEQIKKISQIVRGQLDRSSKQLLNDILPALAKEGIHIRDWSSLDGDTKRRARSYFRREVFPVLTPLAVDPGHPFPFLSNLSISLAVEARDPETRERKFARVKVPEILPRFINLESLDRKRDGTSESGEMNFLPLEELLKANLEELFPGMEVIESHPFRITRDMDIEILEEEAHDLLSIVDREVRRRKFGAVIRLEVAPGIPDRVRRLLQEKLEIGPEDIYETIGPLGVSAFLTLTSLPRRDLRDPPFTPEIVHDFADGTDPFEAIRNNDILIHRPYEAFAPVLSFLHRAAEDPDVLAIKMTLYRTGSNPDLVQSLVRAAENGKQVAVAIELKARFDEANNITWARRLEDAGIHVFFGAAEEKTHAKAALVVRREKDGIRRYVHLSTGNYNPTTARVYTDLCFFTANSEFGEDASELFNSLSGFSKHPRYRKIHVAPSSLADTIVKKIDEQTERARNGKPAYIFAKINALVDVHAIRALYKASQAGVLIDLNVRGICCLRPGLLGVSENIRVFSIVGRFLEHARVFVFGPKDDEQFFLASADWMPRNFYRRVEVMFPIENEKLREKIRREVVEPALNDNCRAQDLDAEGNYLRRHPREGEPERDAQLAVLNRIVRHGLRAVHPTG